MKKQSSKVTLFRNRTILVGLSFLLLVTTVFPLAVISDPPPPTPPQEPTPPDPPGEEPESPPVVPPVSVQVPIAASGNLLVGAVYNDGLTSGDMCLVIQLEANENILVDEEHPVLYFHNQTPSNLAGVTDWMTFDYDDSGWSEGVNGVGYNSSQITEVSDTDDQGAIYSRFARFDIPNAASVTSMTIRVDYDDSFIVWLNEVEVVRANMRTDDIPEWDHDAGGHESTNKPGPDPTRWDATVSNLIENQQDDNPDGTIVVHEFDVVFEPSAVEPAGKVATMWGAIKKTR